MAKEMLDKILACPTDYEDFRVRLELVQLKTRQMPKHLASYPAQEILERTGSGKAAFTVDGKSYQVRMDSDRYKLFRQNRHCAACGLEGTHMVLDLPYGHNQPHFNLYGLEDGQLVLMTKDHIVPRTKGGRDEMANYQTYCHACNQIKGCDDLDNNQVRLIREALRQNKSLSRQEMRRMLLELKEQLKGISGPEP